MKNAVLTLAAVIVAAKFVFAADPISKVAVLNQDNTGIFKVIYEGATAGKVTLKVYDSKGNQLLSETTNGVAKFMRPVNFSGMEKGEYAIEITDVTGTQVQKVTYADAKVAQTPVKAIHITKLQNGKYLMSVATTGKSNINVNIYDGNGNLVHDETRTVNGDLSLVYNLNQVQGQPTFHVVDYASSKKVVK
jgi:hypothetical protein